MDYKKKFQVFDNQTVGIAIFDVQGKYLYWNQQELKLRNLEASSITHITLYELFDDALSQELKHIFQQLLSTKENSSYFSYVSDQHFFQMNLSADQEGNICSILSDKTHENELQKKLNESSENLKRLDDAVQGANIGCWDFFPKEKRIVTNKTWVSQKKFSDKDFRSNTDALFSELINGIDRWKNIIHPNDYKKKRESIEQHLDGTTEHYDAKFRIKFGDGKWHWIHDIGKVFLRDENGEALRMNGVHIDITAEKELELKIEKLLNLDELTRINNRRAYRIRSKEIFSESLRNYDLVAFLLMDIDHFKEYNDTYGHQAGDDVLRDLGSLLNSILLREDDACFRLGGEEFGVIYKAEDHETAISFAEYLRVQIEELKIPHSKSTTSRYITASMGLSFEKLSENIDADKAYKKADHLLYQAKSFGRNCIFTTQGRVKLKL